MRLTAVGLFLVAAVHLAPAAEVATGFAAGQRLSDIGARRICLRLHENERRNTGGA